MCDRLLPKVAALVPGGDLDQASVFVGVIHDTTRQLREIDALFRDPALLARRIAGLKARLDAGDAKLNAALGKMKRMSAAASASSQEGGSSPAEEAKEAERTLVPAATSSDAASGAEAGGAPAAAPAAPATAPAGPAAVATANPHLLRPDPFEGLAMGAGRKGERSKTKEAPLAAGLTATRADGRADDRPVKRVPMILGGGNDEAGDKDETTGAVRHTGAVDSFDSPRLALRQQVLKGIMAMGYDAPSPVQRLALEPLLAGYDVICQAQSGMGKTASFLVPALDALDLAEPARHGRAQVVVLANARELVEQHAEAARALGRFLPGLVVHTCIGGTPVGGDKEMLRHGVHVVVGTPGRVLSLLEHGDLDARGVKMVVLDEADRLLDDNFAEEVRQIFRRFPPNAQTGVFSATMPVDALALAGRLTRPGHTALVRLEGANKALAGIKQYYVEAATASGGGGGVWEAKLEVLADLHDELGVADGAMCMVFCNGKETVRFVGEQLQQHGYSVTGSLRDFRDGRKGCNMLVTTDALARGIDIQQVQFVVNFDLPYDRECYIHRIGRCGRFGRRGVAINLICQGTADTTKLRMIEGAYGQPIEACVHPSSIRTYLGMGSAASGGGSAIDSSSSGGGPAVESAIGPVPGAVGPGAVGPGAVGPAPKPAPREMAGAAVPGQGGAPKEAAKAASAPGARVGRIIQLQTELAAAKAEAKALKLRVEALEAALESKKAKEAKACPPAGERHVVECQGLAPPVVIGPCLPPAPFEPPADN